MAEKFLVDANVGRLARWLRVMGYDSLFLPELDDGEMLRMARREGRTVLTRDRYIMERRVVTSGAVKAVFVASDDFRQQMRQLTETLELDGDNLFSLCIECNRRLGGVEKETVRDRVPAFVFRTQDHFFECPSCSKLYWRGTHWRNMREELAAFTGVTVAP